MTYTIRYSEASRLLGEPWVVENDGDLHYRTSHETLDQARSYVEAIAATYIIDSDMTLWVCEACGSDEIGEITWRNVNEPDAVDTYVECVRCKHHIVRRATTTEILEHLGNQFDGRNKVMAYLRERQPDAVFEFCYNCEADSAFNACGICFICSEPPVSNPEAVKTLLGFLSWLQSLPRSHEVVQAQQLARQYIDERFLD